MPKNLKKKAKQKHTFDSSSSRAGSKELVDPNFIGGGAACGRGLDSVLDLCGIAGGASSSCD